MLNRNRILAELVVAVRTTGFSNGPGRRENQRPVMAGARAVASSDLVGED